MTAATAHAGYEVHGPGLPARGHREVYHAVADQTARAGYDAGPLCGLTRKAGEPLCATPAHVGPCPDGLFAPAVNCRACLAS